MTGRSLEPSARPREGPPAPHRVHTAAATRLRVRYCECDPMGVAHHSSYAAWLEIGRTELLRECGVTYAQLEAAGTFLVITRLELRYRRPIRYDDLVEVRTRWIGGSKVKIEHEYDVVVIERHAQVGPANPTPEIVAATAATGLACVDRAGKIQPLPEWLVHPG